MRTMQAFVLIHEAPRPKVLGSWLLSYKNVLTWTVGVEVGHPSRVPSATAIPPLIPVGAIPVRLHLPVHLDVSELRG